MSHKAVIFDLDGTLYDKSRLPVYLILSDLRHIMWLKAERYARKELGGKDFGGEDAFYEAFFATAAGKAGVSPDSYRRWYFGKYLPSMVKVLSFHYHLYPWVKEVFAGLRARGVKTAVFSDYGAVPGKLRALGFDPSWADKIADAPSFGGLKPSAASFLKMAAALGVSPSECLVVGDRADTDGEGARVAGMSFSLWGSEKEPVSL